MTRFLLMAQVAMLLVGTISVVGYAASGDEVQKLTPVTLALTGVACPSCSAQLQQQLAQVSGVTAVKVTVTQVTAKLDERKISAGTFTARAAAELANIEGPKAGAGLVLYADIIACNPKTKQCTMRDAAAVNALTDIKGVRTIVVDDAGTFVAVSFQQGAHVTAATLMQALARAGFSPSLTQPVDGKQAKGENCVRQ